MQETTRNVNKRFENCHLTPIIPFKISLCLAISSHIRHRIYHSRSCHLVVSHTYTKHLINHRVRIRTMRFACERQFVFANFLPRKRTTLV
jgi:hypothetical protein